MDGTTRQVVLRGVLRYGLGGGVVVVAALVGIGTYGLGVAVKNVLFFGALVAGGLALLPLAVSDSGLESAHDGFQGGFDVTNPSEYRASGLAGNRGLKLAFVLGGTAVVAVVAFLAI